MKITSKENGMNEISRRKRKIFSLLLLNVIKYDKRVK